MIRLTLLFVIACQASAPTTNASEAAPLVRPNPVVKTSPKPKFKLPPADYVPYSNPRIQSHKGGVRATETKNARGRSSKDGEDSQENTWSWPSNATKPNERNAPRYDSTGRRVYRTSELIDDDELSKRLIRQGK